MIRYLQDMVDFLQENPVILLNDNDDGRINSATNENIVLNQLATRFKYIYIYHHQGGGMILQYHCRIDFL